ncbi:MAG: response regulator [Bacteroidales bacterium]|nr:response regulator [Bacteroidales bacterium]
MKQDAGFKLKIIFSYLLLVALALGSGWYVYKHVYPFLFQSEDRREEILERSLLISNSISLLYEAEWLGTRFIQDPKEENYHLYRGALNKVDTLLDSLSRSTPVERQKKILQEIDSLLLCRDTNILDIARQQQELSRRSQQETVVQKVDRALPQLPVMPQVPMLTEVTSRPTQPVVIREEVIYDTIVTALHRPKQTFFERLSHAFVPSQMQDSIMEFRQIRRTVTDSLVRVVPATPAPAVSTTTSRDTVVRAVMQVLDDVEAERQDQLKIIGARLEQLIATDRALNLEINKLLDELNKEWFHSTSSALETRRASLEQAGTSLSILGATALFIIFLFTLLIFTDVNKSRKYRKDLEAARTRAEELMKSRENLLLTVTHDIKAPLSSIVGYLDLLRHPSGKNSPNKTEEYLIPMVHSAEHVMELLANLLEYYRLEAQKVELNPSPTPIRQLFEDALAVFAPAAGKKGIALHLKTDIPAHTYLITDPLRLRQIVMNLLSNAVKFTEKGQISLYVFLEGKELFFSVYDTGIGISPKAKQLIFEEFTQLEHTNNIAKEGMGLGLSIVKRTVDLFKGSISIFQNKDKGSTFSVTIPVQVTDALSELADPPETSDILTAEAASATDKLSSGPLRVLIVDDDPSQRTLLHEMLRMLGHLAATAQGTQQAIALLKTLPIDVVLTDIQMPNEDGFCLLEAVRALKDIPVIAVTAEGMYPSYHYTNKGFTAHLPKPFTLDRLEKLLTGIPSPNTHNLFSLSEMGRMLDADLEAVIQVLQVFYTTARQALTSMEESLESKDYEQIAVLAHKMLPMFRQLHASLANDLAMLERAGGKAPEKVKKVIQQARDLLHIIELHFIV